MRGIAIRKTIGVGDALQFSSLPENYFRATGDRLVDVDSHWFFDHNPFVVRGIEPESVTEMWNFSPKQWDWPAPAREEGVWLANAEIWSAVWRVPMVLNRPRLYRYEDVPFEKREAILLHIDGRSHGDMPDYVIEHVLKKYGPTKRLVQIGKSTRDLGLPKIETPSLWDLAFVISSARMLIGVDSGPAWIAACYPDVVVKKLRTKPSPERFEKWCPLSTKNIHSHWDDRCHQIFNASESDVGFTLTYRKI